MKIKKLVLRWTSAFSAGLIAHNCRHCIVDDKAEMIIPCPKHKVRLAELAKVNEDNAKK